jgi:tRNA(Glu) U13 pseudouridine synthase TruD
MVPRLAKEERGHNFLPLHFIKKGFPFCRLSSTNSSFIPSSVREWNKLENSVRNLDTPLKFKRALLKNRNEINSFPKHFMYGPRKLNVILTQRLDSYLHKLDFGNL